MSRREKSALYQEIVNRLLEEIQDGTLPPGSKVPSQNRLAEMFGVSTITSRRALAELERMGVINRIQGKGSFVMEAPKSKGNKGSIGFLIQYNLSDSRQLYNPILAAALRSAGESASRHGFEVSFHTLGTEEPFRDIGRHQAWILCGNLARETVEAVAERGAVAVTVNTYFPDLGVPFLSFDNVAGGFIATSHLIELGHREIAFVGPQLPRYNQFGGRLRGYELALEQHGVSVNQEWIIESDTNESTTANAVRGLLGKGRVTGAFASTDATALGIVRAARELGLHVPSDLSVVGYDDQPFARYCQPPLTTIRQDGFELGRRAFSLLHQMLMGDKPPTLRLELPPDLIRRSSTQAPKRQDS